MLLNVEWLVKKYTLIGVNWSSSGSV